jgi:predicted phosphodiesterase
MRVAVFSDVHGNLTALEAVLKDIENHGVDEIVFAGDLCLIGPRPSECAARVHDMGIPAVYGNTDEWLLGRRKAPSHLAELAAWTNDQLHDAERLWLEGQPFSYSVSPGGGAGSELLIVHANPQDVDQPIFPSEEEQVARYGRVRQPDEDLDELLAGCSSKQIAFGHLHVPFVRQHEETTLFNISSVSIAGDGDPRAKYGLFTWASGDWSFEHVFISYDMAQEADAYQLQRPPGREKFLETIRANGYLAQNV